MITYSYQTDKPERGWSDYGYGRLYKMLFTRNMREEFGKVESAPPITTDHKL